jgi:NADP-reducing hydrogenase subunit HndB
MPQIKSLEELKRLKAEATEKRQARTTAGRAQVVVGMGTCGIAAGARETMKAILDSIEKDNVSGVVVSQTGCIGLCEWEPIVEVSTGGGPKVTYGKVTPEKARRIMKEHVMDSHIIQEYQIPG